MPAATPKKGYPYPTGTDTPQGPASFQALAEAVENAFPFTFHIEVVPVSVSASNVALQAYNFPAGFNGVTTYAMVNSRTSTYVASHGAAYSGPPAGMTIAVRHIDGTSATTTVEVEVWLIQKL